MNKYVITDAYQKVWVCRDNNGYTLSTDPNKAHIFENKKTADAIYKSSLSKVIKSKGVAVKSIKMQVCDDVPQESAPPIEVDSSKYIVSIISDAVSKLNCRHFELSEELSKIDREKSDIEHYIEFNAGKLNACGGYKAYKMLQDVLLERRKVKDELEIIQVAMARIASPEELANIDRKVEELAHRKYEPREFKHLFKEN